MVFFPDASSLADPSTAEVAEKLGLHVRPELAFYDLIVDGGPAGLAVAVYGGSEGLRTVMLETRGSTGGSAPHLRTFLYHQGRGRGDWDWIPLPNSEEPPR